jgi:hypothetical protein
MRLNTDVSQWRGDTSIRIRSGKPGVCVRSAEKGHSLLCRLTIRLLNASAATGVKALFTRMDLRTGNGEQDLDCIGGLISILVGIDTNRELG